LRLRILISALIAAFALAASDPQADAVTRKIDLIENAAARPGSVFVFTSSELNAWVRSKAPSVVAQGFRNPRLELGNDAATGYALVDFLKIRSASGLDTNWLLAKLIEGEKPVSATAEIRSANGQLTVHLKRVEIGGIAVTGSALDFLIKNFFLPLYPNAQIDQPVALADGVDHIQVSPDAARVYIKRK